MLSFPKYNNEIRLLIGLAIPWISVRNRTDKPEKQTIFF